MADEQLQLDTLVANLPQVKRCPQCGEMKSLEEYYTDKRTRNGKRSWCKACCSLSRQQYLQTESGRFAAAQSTSKTAAQRMAGRSTAFFRSVFGAMRARCKKGPGGRVGRNNPERLAAMDRGEAALRSIITDNCPYCSAILDYKSHGNTQLDHKIPTSKYKNLQGSISNLQWICKVCNMAKSDLTEDEFLQHVARIYHHCNLAATINLTQQTDSGDNMRHA